MNELRILTAALSIVVWSSCTPSKESRTPTDKPVVIIVGTMHHLEIEGGCWWFRPDAGESYELVGDLAKQLHVVGRRAKLKIKPRSDLASICMVGTIAEVVEIIQVF